MEQQGACGLDFDGGPGNCGAVRNPAAHGNGRFMLKAEPAHPRPGDRNRASRRSGPAAVQAPLLLLRYPDERLVGARDEIAAAIAALPRPERAQAARAALPSTWRRATQLSSSPAPTSRPSTCTGARASTSPTTSTATRASAAWRCCG